MPSLFISKAPDDPKEKDEWAQKMLGIQIAMWIGDKATCIHCGHQYESVDDFRRCNPKSGMTKKLSFVCSGCWPEYEKVCRP